MNPAKTITWILIADGARARLASVERHGSSTELVEKFEYQADHRPSRELGRDRPARVHESQGATRHAVEPKVDPHRALKREFADTISEALDDNLAQKNFDRLIVVAPPVTLGDLRRVFSEPVKSKIFAEVAMDLTKVPNSEVPRHIADLIET